MELTYFSTLFSFLALGMALAIAYGEYEPTAFAATLIALVALALACCLSAFKTDLKLSTPSASTKRILALLISVFFCLALMQAGPPILYGMDPSLQGNYFPYLSLMGLFTLLVPLFKNKPKFLYSLFGLSLLLWLIFSIRTISWVPSPRIDVWHLHQKAAQSLFQGQNPYRQTFSIPLSTRLFEITDRYVYPPFPLLLTGIFYYFFGDVRFGMVFCQLASALILFGITRLSQLELSEGVLLTLLFLVQPRWFFVLSQSWTEPCLIALLYASVFLILKKRAAFASFFLGLALGAKQYLAPMILVFHRALQNRIKNWAIFLGTFSLIPLVFFLAGPSDFFENVIRFHFQSAFRERSLSLSSYLFQSASLQIPPWIAFFALGLCLVVAGFRKRFIQALLWASLGYFLFFWLNKQAFCNYYFFVEALLILALALIPSDPLSLK